MFLNTAAVDLVRGERETLHLFTELRGHGAKLVKLSVQAVALVTTYGVFHTVLRIMTSSLVTGYQPICKALRREELTYARDEETATPFDSAHLTQLSLGGETDPDMVNTILFKGADQFVHNRGFLLHVVFPFKRGA